MPTAVPKKHKPEFTRISPKVPNKNHASPFDLAIIASPTTLKPRPLSTSPTIAYQNHFLCRFFLKVFVISKIRNESNHRNNGYRIIYKIWRNHFIATCVRM